jgi:hypothetical protein
MRIAGIGLRQIIGRARRLDCDVLIGRDCHY